MALNLSVQSRAEMVQNILNLTQLRYAKRNSSLVKIVSLCVLILLLLIIIIALHHQQQSRQFASAASTTATLEAETATFASPVSRATASTGNYMQFNQPINTSTGTVFDGVNVDMCLITHGSLISKASLSEWRASLVYTADGKPSKAMIRSCKAESEVTR